MDFQVISIEIAPLNQQTNNKIVCEPLCKQCDNWILYIIFAVVFGTDILLLVTNDEPYSAINVTVLIVSTLSLYPDFAMTFDLIFCILQKQKSGYWFWYLLYVIIIKCGLIVALFVLEIEDQNAPTLFLLLYNFLFCIVYLEVYLLHTSRTSY